MSASSLPKTFHLILNKESLVLTPSQELALMSDAEDLDDMQVQSLEICIYHI